MISKKHPSIMIDTHRFTYERLPAPSMQRKSRELLSVSISKTATRKGNSHGIYAACYQAVARERDIGPCAMGSGQDFVRARDCSAQHAPLTWSLWPTARSDSTKSAADRHTITRFWWSHTCRTESFYHHKANSVRDFHHGKHYNRATTNLPIQYLSSSLECD